MERPSAETTDTAETQSVRATLRALRAAFERGGAAELALAHARALERSFRYRIFHRLLSLAVPTESILAAAKNLDRLIDERDACAASREILARLRIPWQIDLPENGVADILSAPVVFYGTHEVALTPLLLAAALDRSDLKMVAASPIARIGPHVGKYAFPVYTAPPAPAATRKRRFLPTGSRARLRIEIPLEREEARTRNRASLGRAADHVRRGGALAIAPDPRRRKGPWRPGLGVLIVGLAHDAGTRPAYAVPWSITHVPTAAVLQVLSPNPLIRALGRARFRHPVHIAFGEPVPVRRIVELAGYNPAKVVEHLEREYRERGL